MSDETAPGVLRGRAIAFDSPAVISTSYGNFQEIIAPTAISPAVLGDGQITCVFNHDPSLLLGRQIAGTLTLTATSGGVDFACTLPATDVACMVATSVERGDLRGASFAFELGRVSWYEPAAGADLPTCVIEEITRLFDVSAVVWPAYPATSLALQRSGTDLRSDRALALRMRTIEASKRVHARPGKPRRSALAVRTARLARTVELGIGPRCRTLPRQAVVFRTGPRRIVR